MVPPLIVVAGMFMCPGAHANDTADRFKHQDSPSKSVSLGSDDLKTSLGVYSKFMADRFEYIKHAGGPDPLSIPSGHTDHNLGKVYSQHLDMNGNYGGMSVSTVFDSPDTTSRDKHREPTAYTQDSMAFTSASGQLLLDANYVYPTKKAEKEDKKALRKPLANPSKVSMGLLAIGVSVLSLAAMLGARMRRGMRSAAVFASSSSHVADIPISVAQTSNENILELKAGEATNKGQEGVRKDNFRIREWFQPSSTTSRHLTVSFATSPGDEEAGGAGKNQDEDPYAFIADADLAASYSDRDSWSQGAATLLVGVNLRGAALDFDASISELADLATGAGLSISGPPLRRRLRQPDPQTYTDAVGVDHIKDAIAELVGQGAEEVAIVFDDELTPDQQKNLERRLQVAPMHELMPRAKIIDRKKRAMEKQERVWQLRAENGHLSQAAARAQINKEDRLLRRRGGLSTVVAVRVLDRTAVVLDIFAKRATSRTGRLQVALALTLYQTPRQGGLFRGIDDERETGGSLGTNKQERRRTMMSTRNACAIVPRV
jgi:uncharacterized protein YerC